MLGWHVSVYRLPEGGRTPPERDATLGEQIAVWQSGRDGLDWLHDLVQADRALILGGNGYPAVFAGRARDLLPEIISGPPSANPRWLAGKDDIITGEWVGRTLVDSEVLEDCDPDEWLLVQAWDES